VQSSVIQRECAMFSYLHSTMGISFVEHACNVLIRQTVPLKRKESHSLRLRWITRKKHRKHERTKKLIWDDCWKSPRSERTGAAIVRQDVSYLNSDFSMHA